MTSTLSATETELQAEIAVVASAAAALLTAASTSLQT